MLRKSRFVSSVVERPVVTRKAAGSIPARTAGEKRVMSTLEHKPDRSPTQTSTLVRRLLTTLVAPSACSDRLQWRRTTPDAPPILAWSSRPVR